MVISIDRMVYRINRELYLSDIQTYFATRMKRQRLHVEYEIDFEVFGIVSAFRDFKLAWNINQTLHLNLVKREDLRLKFIDYDLVVSHYQYETENADVRLIRNRSYDSQSEEGSFFIPELTGMDFFLRSIGEELPNWPSELRRIEGIEFVNRIDLDRLKSKENFIF